MAEEKSRFFDSVSGDRRYSSEEFAEYFSSFLTTGIKNGGSNLQVTSTGSSMQINISPGIAMIRGYLYLLEGSEGLDLSINASDAQNRIDRIVLRLDRGASVRSIYAAVKKGEPAAAPVPPVLTREGNIFEISLAQIYIKANAVKVLPADITDERYNTSVCGLINSLITLDTTEFQQQAQAAVEALRSMGGEQLLMLLQAVDGAGSELDADFLDGQHGDYYLDYNNLNHKPSIKGNGAPINSDANNCVNITPANIGAATVAQGNKADSAIQGIKCNGVTVTPNADKTVNVTLSLLGGQTVIAMGTAPPNANTPGNIYIQY